MAGFSITLIKSIIVLIPAHNEQARISGVVADALKYLPVLVVDDGSTDNTAKLAKTAGANILIQTPNQGKGAALLAGFKQSLKLGYEAVITLDGDGQHDPADIPIFLAAYKKRPSSLLVGRRNFSDMPISRQLANKLGRILISLAVGQLIPDNQSGYRLIRKELMNLMLENNERGFEFEVDMIVLALKNHLDIDWIPIKTIYTGGQSHIKPLRHIYNYLRVTVKAWKSMHSG